MCWWHIEAVVNWVVEYALYSRNSQKSMLNDFFVQIDVCFSCRKFNLDHESLWKTSSDAQRNFAKEHFLLRILQNRPQRAKSRGFCRESPGIVDGSLVEGNPRRNLGCQWNENITAVVCCREYKRNSFSLNNRSIQAAKYNLKHFTARNYSKTQKYDCRTGQISGLSDVLFYPEC